MTRIIDYGNLMHRAMRGLIQNVLIDVNENGLPGQHHFFITFDTMHPDVEIADWLSDRYPDEMTVVMQHWFDNLEITNEGFSVTLNFGDSPEPLYIPYEAIFFFSDSKRKKMTKMRPMPRKPTLIQFWKQKTKTDPRKS